MGTECSGSCRMLRLLLTLRGQLPVLSAVFLVLWSPLGFCTMLNLPSGLSWTGPANEEVLGSGGSCISV